ncbi:MAG TPA: S9 family peptidase [Chloroflexota bacterium]|nr:S9 family peptidase [Chloroflexota bacterium]
MPSRRSARRAVTADDLYRLRFVSDPQVSPDGSQVAYVVAWVDPDERTRYRSQIMLVPFDGSSAPRPLTSGRHRDSAPRWSPDGCYLAFLSNREKERPQLFVLPLQGGEARQLTSLGRGAGAARWSHNGDRLAFAAKVDVKEIAEQEGHTEENGKQPRVRIVTRVKYQADGEGLLESLRKHLFVVDVDGNSEARQITDGDWDDGEPAWSPDGRHIAFTSSRERDRDLTMLNDVWLVPSTGGRARRLTRHRGQASTPSFSPDGQQVAFYGHEQGWRYGARTELLCVAPGGGEVRSLSDSLDAELGNVALSDARDPFAAQPPHWLPDGRGLLALVSRNGSAAVWRFDAAGGAPRPVFEGPCEVASFSASRDGGRLACAMSDPLHPYEVFTGDASEQRQVTHENADWLESVDLQPVEPFSVTSTDGQQVAGWLMKPRGFAARKKYPLVLEVHGGPEAMYSWSFFHEFQLLAARGYGVLFTNPRGSKGYGEAFTARIFADWGNQDYLDCMAAVDAATSFGWVDAQRLGVTGGSYGGFMTAWLVGHTDRFAAAVATRGCYNFSSFYGTSDIGPTFGDYILGGPVYERSELYHERSPLTYAPRMRTPLLLIHNEGDLRCPMEQAEQLFVRLRRLGKVETELIRFPEESHGLSRSGRPDRRVERLERIVGWFDRFLTSDGRGGRR